MNEPRFPVRRLIGVGVAVLSLAVTSACSDGSSGDASAPDGPASTTSTTEPIPVTDAVPQAPQPGPTEAVEAVLAAEQAGDHAGSFAVLSDEGRRLYSDQAEWQDRRNELPLITGFDVQESNAEQVIVLVRHEPGLDPFLGLSAAEERQVWTAVEVDGGWLVNPEPDTDYVLPSDAEAQAAAVGWAEAVQACDDAAAAELQALPTLYGGSQQLAELCGATGTPTAGPVANLDAGPASADIVAQYSSDALIWARVVPVTISGVSLTIALAPIGDVWKVMAVSD